MLVRVDVSEEVRGTERVSIAVPLRPSAWQRSRNWPLAKFRDIYLCYVKCRAFVNNSGVYYVVIEMSNVCL